MNVFGSERVIMAFPSGVWYLQDRVERLQHRPERPSRRRTSARVLELLMNDCRERFFPSLNVGDMVLLSFANFDCYHAVSDHFSVIHSIHRRLSRFFCREAIDTFCKIQIVTGCLISGSFALQFYTGENYESSDLDLYCNVRSSSLVARFLLYQGYKYNAANNQPSGFDAMLVWVAERRMATRYGEANAQILTVLNFVRTTSVVTNQVQLIVTPSSPVEAIFNFHSRPTHAIALYPYTTFRLKETVTLASKRKTPKSFEALRKYEFRGYMLTDSPSVQATCVVRSEFAHYRAIGDRACWVIPLAPLEGADVESCGTTWMRSFMANSWGNNMERFGRFGIRYGVGGNCGWRTGYTWAECCFFMRTHDVVLLPECPECFGDARDEYSLWPEVHSVVTASSFVESPLDSFLLRFVRLALLKAPYYAPVGYNMLPDGTVAWNILRRLRTVYRFLRWEPRVVVAFELGSDERACRLQTVVRLYVPVPEPGLDDAVVCVSENRNTRLGSDTPLKFSTFIMTGMWMMPSGDLSSVSVSDNFWPSVPTRRLEESPANPEIVQVVDAMWDDMVSRYPEVPGTRRPRLTAKEYLEASLAEIYGLFRAEVQVGFSM
ncbi:hypothetical protein V5O48_005225 [Marasmius crinis-equi]|uniref:Uncharacterized protein n=1 Tax=Marasmius crinis-equi TaxID=585013 RepID=A0ABR3FMZ9_9AGAR